MLKAFLHRHVWQRLPRIWRRSLLLSGVAVVAGSITRDAKRSGPIIVAGPFRTSSGLGESARLCHDALVQEGHDVYGIDLTTLFNQNEDFNGFSFRDGSSLVGEGLLILHVNAPFMDMAFLKIGRAVIHQKWIIGYWAWELEKLPADWTRGASKVHEVWVPSHFIARAVKPILDDKPLRVVAHPLAIKENITQKGRHAMARADSPFTVLSILNSASSIDRKNPFAVIEAFDRAFAHGENVQMILKISNLTLVPETAKRLRQRISAKANIKLVEDILSPEEMQTLYAESDMFLSLHRSEGFGLPMAEAMLQGLPVVAVRWSGEVDYLQPQFSFPVEFKLIAAHDQQDTYQFPDQQWADADIASAAAGLRQLYEKLGQRHEMGQAARLYALHVWSSKRYVQSAGLERL